MGIFGDKQGRVSDKHSSGLSFVKLLVAWLNDVFHNPLHRLLLAFSLHRLGASN